MITTQQIVRGYISFVDLQRLGEIKCIALKIFHFLAWNNFFSKKFFSQNGPPSMILRLKLSISHILIHFKMVWVYLNELLKFIWRFYVGNSYFQQKGRKIRFWAPHAPNLPQKIMKNYHKILAIVWHTLEVSWSRFGTFQNPHSDNHAQNILGRSRIKWKNI